MALQLRKLPSEGIHCSSCRQVGFFCATPCGADCDSCPICGDLIYPDDSDDDSDEKLQGTFCKHCQLVFDFGCIHSEIGCTDDIYYAEMVTSYSYNGETFIGTPKIETKKEFQELCQKGYTFNFTCMCGGKSYDCKKAHYVREPVYSKCEENLSNTTNELLLSIKKSLIPAKFKPEPPPIQINETNFMMSVRNFQMIRLMGGGDSSFPK